MATDRTGVLIIRAWVEEGSSEPVRAHILMTDDVSLGDEREVTLSRIDAVSAQVEEWLSQFFSGVERPREGVFGGATAMSLEKDSEHLTLAEAAQLLGMAPSTLERWAAAERISSTVTASGERTFRRSELLRRGIKAAEDVEPEQEDVDPEQE